LTKIFRFYIFTTWLISQTAKYCYIAIQVKGDQ